MQGVVVGYQAPYWQVKIFGPVPSHLEWHFLLPRQFDMEPYEGAPVTLRYKTALWPGGANGLWFAEIEK